MKSNQREMPGRLASIDDVIYLALTAGARPSVFPTREADDHKLCLVATSEPNEAIANQFRLALADRGYKFRWTDPVPPSQKFQTAVLVRLHREKTKP